MKTITKTIWLTCIAILLAFTGKAQTPTTCSTAVTYTYPVTQTVTSYTPADYWFKVTTPGAGVYMLDVTMSSSGKKVKHAHVYTGSCSSLTAYPSDSLTDTTKTVLTIPLCNTVSTTYYIDLDTKGSGAATFTISTIRELYIAGNLDF